MFRRGLCCSWTGLGVRQEIENPHVDIAQEDDGSETAPREPRIPGFIRRTKGTCAWGALRTVLAETTGYADEIDRARKQAVQDSQRALRAGHAAQFPFPGTLHTESAGSTLLAELTQDNHRQNRDLLPRKPRRGNLS
jgi:hypothetical protein